jgi:hypothetical protein
MKKFLFFLPAHSERNPTMNNPRCTFLSLGQFSDYSGNLQGNKVFVAFIADPNF